MKTGLKTLSFFGFVALVAGCAADAPYTAQTVSAHEAAYRECVRSKALEASSASAAPQELARKAGIQCQGQLVVINDRLREENRWRHYYGGFADRYTENLQAQTLDAVASELAGKRN